MILSLVRVIEIIAALVKFNTYTASLRTLVFCFAISINSYNIINGRHIICVLFPEWVYERYTHGWAFNSPSSRLLI